MGLITNYNLRSMTVRKATAAMTAGGIAMVVAVFVMTLAIAQGFRATLVASGSPDNVIVLRKASTSEMVSAVPRVAMPMIESLPQVARDGQGHPLASGEMVVIVALPRLTDNHQANVPTRGVGPRALQIRSPIRFLLVFISRLVDCELGLQTRMDQTLYCLVSNRTLQSQFQLESGIA